MNSAELDNLTSKTEQVSNQAETSQEVQSNCQGYLVDPVSKLHLCNACEYHKYRNEIKVLFCSKRFLNESKPWLK